MKTKPIRIRSIHYKGPQPGKLAVVTDIVQVERNGQWLDCYVAQFPDGEVWHCPVQATKDYERVED